MVRMIKKILDKIRRTKIIPIKCSIENGCMLKGKTALICGGSGDIGKAIAVEFQKQGCNVIISGTNQEKLKKICDHVTGIESIVIDLSDIRNLDARIEEAEMIVGDKINIFVNATGVGGTFTFGQVTPEQWDSVMDINIKGAYFLCQAIGNYMIKNKIKGHILNVSSSSALRPAWSPYQISKWALKGMNVGLADKLLPHGIIVNAIAPGPVATKMLGKTEASSIDMPLQPSGRYALPEEIATLATYMVSDLGDLIVGDTFYITGGSGIVSLHH